MYRIRHSLRCLRCSSYETIIREVIRLARAVSLIQDLQSFPVTCIYALVDESAKGMYVYFSDSRAIVQLSLAIMELKHGIHPNAVIQEAYRSGRLEVRILKDYCDSPPIEAIIRAECAHLIRSSGYADLRGIHLPAYRIKKRIMGYNTYDTSIPPLVYVIAQSQTRDAIVMGVFDHMIDADAWIAQSFPNGAESVGIVPSFALNERTREYHELHGYKLVKSRDIAVRG